MQIDHFKTENYTDFMRLHTVRGEHRYVKRDRWNFFCI
ncbi:hypothetical protein BFO_1295 [Tannerella forsythia 92A2]|uniref:Uncharacterized protein n=1 Tax=Tannerella forsythia (strain ATCC 43037 / JCM 10827 / CCUG 21028 A / KCTC 5666 / FDC 338) TaxID=203275 RepID=G8UJS6_TANFA|nr:hypothetical protein BFO_1295 [Tannerella forsythia 92A2]